MNENGDITKEVIDTLGIESLKPFRPVAYFNIHMDCIRIELRDCSFTEERVNKHITLLEDNYPGPHREVVAGIMIKGIKHLFIECGLRLEGIVQVTTILDQLVKRYPKFAEEEICKLVNQMDLSVDMSERDALATA
jgi:hypothetical protein